MNSPSDYNYRELGSPNGTMDGNNKNGHLVSINGEVEAKHRLLLVQWLTSLLPLLNFSASVTDGELRACLSNGTVLIQILNRLRPGSVTLVSESDHSLPSQSENVKTFLKALDGLGLPRFEISDLEKGSMKPVVDCLLTLRARSLQNALADNICVSPRSRGSSPSSNPYSPPSFGGDQRKESRFQRLLSSPVMAEPSASLIHYAGHKFHEVFQIKPGSFADLPAAKISEMMKSNSLDNLMLQNAPTQSLLSVVNGILEESVERRNGEIPQRVAVLLRRVSQEIERRISTQAEHIRTQNNLFKAREEKYQSRIKVLEALASETREESEEQEDKNLEIAKLQRELETCEAQCLQLEEEAKVAIDELRHKSQEYEHQLEELRNKIKEEGKKADEKDVIRWMKEHDDKKLEISALKQELETAKKTCEVQCLQLEEETKVAKAELRQKSQEYECRLEELRNKVKDFEASSESRNQKWSTEKKQMRKSIDFQICSLQKLKLSWESIKQDVMKEQKACAEECGRLGVNLKPLVHAAQSYQVVLAENRKLFNEVQELKGNIRVYCRIRPFLTGKGERQTIIQHIGENDLVVAHPSKEGKDALKSFKFNKVFGPASTQVEVYSDIQSFVRSVLDGYNVCMFAYGQTGSGKTYTMTGPSGATSEDIGVNYRALNDLFSICTSRASLIDYEIGVQMVEIYNEQVRDLLTTDGSPKKLGILTHSPSKGLAVPDASIFPVKSPSDVIKLMDIGLKNRAIGATAMNERSSRSHSVISIHVRGKELKSGSTLLGNLHLVDLAGSERVDRSEVIGDRLKEAQHINKSLSALGDVIFALSQKSPHVPYRNSKLTQLLQTSLGGQAKTLMFVQINSDVSSYSETLSTLKFADRVSGVELGAARSNKESKDVRELMEQMASMKNTILKKDEEIERLQSLNASVGGVPKKNRRLPSYKNLEASTEQPMDGHIHQNELLHQSEITRGDIRRNIASTAETSGSADSDSHEGSSDVSDNGVVPGTETDGSSENSSLTEVKKSLEKTEKSKALPKIVRTVRKLDRTPSLTPALKDSQKKPPASSGIKKSASIGQLKAAKRWQ
ncbi:kinesin-like protein KIN-14C isoform X3 [Lotus japonicus]|uniref:kinesin-like protein KIN-14C isoform X3 n=1 Tax=Lotus japonicus TaxID=34305 RepID=UPI00258D0465|nr:kinesin-like protein KIN-14C isoform X3 [Lotus japonicus]